MFTKQCLNLNYPPSLISGGATCIVMGFHDPNQILKDSRIRLKNKFIFYKYFDFKLKEPTQYLQDPTHLNFSTKTKINKFISIFHVLFC